MKLSVELYTLSQRLGDLAAIDMVKNTGFDAIDYSYYWNNENEEILGDNYKEYASNLRKYMDEVGIVCNQAHAPFSLSYGCRFDETDETYLRLIRAIESASILGAENIIVHALTVPKGVDFVDYNIEYYRSLIPYCEKFGVHAAVENLFKRDEKRKCLIGKLGSPEELKGIVERINSPWIVACVDVGHASLTGCEPEEFIAGMNSKILKSLHIQDNDYISDRHVLPYMGELNWEAIMTALKNVGYEGDLTFEIFNYLNKFPASLIPETMKFAEAVGRYLISLYEK